MTLGIKLSSLFYFLSPILPWPSLGQVSFQWTKPYAKKQNVVFLENSVAKYHQSLTLLEKKR